MATPYRMTTTFWDHATLWNEDDESLAGHTTDGGRVFGITRTRHAECDRYGCQPVAVVAYEDREQVERLASVHKWMGTNANVVGDLADALREFANPKPPKPDEPTGLGAVVQDDDGVLWVRYTADTERAAWRRDDPLTASQPWERVNAIEVLSEGVIA